MYRLAVSLLYDEDESKDVVSDVFASLLDGSMTLSSDNARGFLLTCVRNSCINVIRHKRVRERFANLYSASGEPLADGPDDTMMLDELRDYINKQLPPLTCRIFTSSHHFLLNLALSPSHRFFNRRRINSSILH